MTSRNQTAAQPKTPAVSLMQASAPRPQIVEAEAGDSNPWAVSYSDLLMVLMSFFIIFFSFEDAKPVPDSVKKIADFLTDSKIVNQLRPEDQLANTTTAQSTAPGAITQAPTDTDKSTQNRLAERLSDLMAPSAGFVSETTLADGLIIEFNGNIFGSGKWNVDQKLSAQLDLFVSALMAQSESIEIEVIGEADRQPVTLKPGKIATDNLILSSLRASSVVKYLTKKGFSEGNLKASGVGSTRSGKRSVSLKVTSKIPALKPVKVEAR